MQDTSSTSRCSWLNPLSAACIRCCLRSASSICTCNASFFANSDRRCSSCRLSHPATRGASRQEEVIAVSSRSMSANSPLADTIPAINPGNSQSSLLASLSHLTTINASFQNPGNLLRRSMRRLTPASIAATISVAAALCLYISLRCSTCCRYSSHSLWQCVWRLLHPLQLTAPQLLSQASIPRRSIRAVIQS